MSEITATAHGLAAEEAPSMSDLATSEEGAGAWTPGWYRALIVEGYTTGKGKVFETADQLSKNADSRNLFVCLEVAGDSYVPSSPDPRVRVLTKGPGGKRQTRATLNYQPSDLTVERIQQVKEGRERYKHVNGAWPDKSLQSSSLSLGRIGQFEKALGFKSLPRAGGRYDVSKMIGHQIDVRLNISDKGFNEVAAFAPAGFKVK